MHVSAGIVEGNASRPDHLPGEDSQKQEGKKLKKLQADIKKAVKKDKQSHIIEQFRENKEDKHKKHLWKAIKAMKTKFTPTGLYLNQYCERCLHNARG
jgi:hypothetical protein